MSEKFLCGQKLRFTIAAAMLVATISIGSCDLPPNKAAVIDSTWSSTGSKLAYCEAGGTIRVIDLSSRRVFSRFEVPQIAPIPALAMDSSGHLAVAMRRGIGVWDISSGKLKAKFAVDNSVIRYVSFSPDGRYLAASGENGPGRVWDIRKDKRMLVFQASGSVGWHPNSRLLAGGQADGSIVIWDLNSRKAIKRFRNLGTARLSWFESIQWNPSGDRLVTYSGSIDSGRSRVWDIVGGKLLFTLANSPNPQWSLDGKYIISVGKWGMHVWFATSGRLKRINRFTSPSYTRSLVPSPNSSLVAAGQGPPAGTGGMLSIIDTSTGRVIAQFGHMKAFNIPPDKSQIL